MIIRQCLFILLLLIEMAATLDCFRNTPEFNSEVQYCNPSQFPYCLKADSFDGNVYRNCATLDQCPQGPNCAQITYEEDQTTDYVCCCSSPLCNSALGQQSSTFLIISLSILFCFSKILAKVCVFV